MSIELIFGPMFSGKTTRLISKIERFLIAKKKVIAIKWKGDTRYTKEPCIMTHSGLTCECIPADDNDLKTIYQQIKDYNIICIDEGSFFKNIVEFSEFLANNGHRVIIASLVGTFERKGFNDILNLIPKCENIEMLHAICMMCHCEGAAFTKRISNSGEVEMVGGADSYQSLCRACFNK